MHIACCVGELRVPTAHFKDHLMIKVDYRSLVVDQIYGLSRSACGLGLLPGTAQFFRNLQRTRSRHTICFILFSTLCFFLNVLVWPRIWWVLQDYTAKLTGDQSVPPVQTSTEGTFELDFNKNIFTRSYADCKVSVNGPITVRFGGRSMCVGGVGLIIIRRMFKAGGCSNP